MTDSFVERLIGSDTKTNYSLHLLFGANSAARLLLGHLPSSNNCQKSDASEFVSFVIQISN